MIDSIIHLCRSYPQIPVFLALAIGYAVGKIRIFKFTLGSTAGVLLAALVVGQMHIAVPVLLRTVGFALFIFTIGYKVGPQFFGALKKEGLKYLWLSLVVAVTGLLTAIGISKLLGFDGGTAAGLLSGAMTQSAVIGTAEGAIRHLSISAAAKATMESNVAIAYAITYIFGTAGLVVFFKIVPRLMKIDLKKEARKLEAEMSGNEPELESPDLFLWYKRLSIRVFKITNTELSGKTVSELEAMLPVGQDAVEKIIRQNKLIDKDPATVLQTGDEISIAGKRTDFIKAEKLIGPEIDDAGVGDVIGETLGVCVLKPDVVGKTLDEISLKYGYGCFLRRMTRQGHELPLTRNTVVHKCDVLEIVGAQKDVDNFVENVGYPERSTATTDMVLVGIGCVLGTLLGLAAVPLFGIPLTLGIGGGVLVSGLICGWLRGIHPTFGQIPTGAQWIFTDFGLNLFIACVGLTAGPKAVQALQTSGISIFLAGIIVTLTPMIIGLLFGKLILKLNPVLLFGALTGAGTITAALNALKEEADSSVPALGYAAPYAFGNVLLTIWGTIIIYVLH